MKGKKDKGPSIKKPIFKKWWFWVIIVVILAAIIGGGGGNKNEAPTTTGAPSTGTSTPQASDSQKEVSPDSFVADVKDVIQGAISSKDESIIDVVLQNSDLCVYVDFSEKDPAPLTLEDLALARTSSITDAILELKDYDSLWETITVDFGATGHVTNSKENMETNGAGRYFSADDFKLE